MSLIESKLKYLMVLLSLFSVTSCINDSYKDCPPETANGHTARLEYNYTPAQISTRHLDPQEIQRVTVFIFDSNDRFLSRIDDDTPEFGFEYATELDLDPGWYTFVVWMNLMDYYGLSAEELIEEHTTLSELTLELLSEAEDMYESVPDNLFYGNVEREEILDGQDNVFVVDMTRDTYTINVTTVGLGAENELYRFMIADNNAVIRFDNSLTKERDIYYVTECEKTDDGELDGSLTVLRLLEDHKNATIRLLDTDDDIILFEDNLIELLLYSGPSGSMVNFSHTYEFDIVIRFDSSMDVTIDVNGWRVKESGSVIHGRTGV